LAQDVASFSDICNNGFMDKRETKLTTCLVDFELYIKALPELKRRKMTFSQFVNESLAEFVRLSNKQNKRIRDERNTTSEQQEAGGEEASSRGEGNKESQEGGEGS